MSDLYGEVGCQTPRCSKKRWANVLSTLAATGLYRCSGWQYMPQAPHSSPFANNFNSFLPFLLGETRLNSNQQSAFLTQLRLRIWPLI